MASQVGGAFRRDCALGNCGDAANAPLSPLAECDSKGAHESGSSAPAFVRVTRIEVHRGHLVCLVSFTGAPRVTSARLMERMLRSFPNLPYHACVNEQGTTFAVVMNRTPLPHLLEHLAVDLQVRAQVEGACNSESSTAVNRVASLTAGSNVASDVQERLESHERPIVGTSEWLDEASGVARIDLSFVDDQIALRALRDAVAFLNEALGVES